MQTNAATATTRLVTLRTASKEWGVPYTSLRDLVIRGHLPRIRLGTSKRIWLSRETVERFIRQSEERQ